MQLPTAARTVRLIDGRVPVLTPVEARLYLDLPALWLDVVESQWAEARARAAGSGGIEHAHWNWRNKRDRIADGRLRLVAVEYEGDLQGVMAIDRIPRPALLSPGSAVYVDYVEAAPWNLRVASSTARFVGVGTALVVAAIRLSRDESYEGRVGLHSLPQAEAFYTRCGLTRVGIDHGYYDLPYYECTSQRAADWLQELEVTT